MMEPHTTKLTRVGEHKRSFALIKYKVFVLVWMEFSRCDMDISGHAKMNTEPVSAREYE